MSNPNDNRILVLASQSPRRAELLSGLGVAFEVMSADVDESPLDGEFAAAYVTRVAQLKVRAGVAAAGAGRVVLAADTTVALDDRIYGKPRDHEHARRMLRRLAGRWHEVLSAVVVADAEGNEHLRLVTAKVEFAALDDAVIEAYVSSGEPADKAGAYAIQGLGGVLVRRLEGSYSAVVGLPLHETAALLDIAGVRHALSPH